MTTVFITGATGFIGRAVLPQVLKCLKPEDRVYLLVRKPVESVDKRVVTILGDLKSLDKVADFVRKADFVIHIAGESRLCGGSGYSLINVTATQELVNIVKESGTLERFIFISSIAAMDRSASDMCNDPVTVASPCCPRSEYGQSKLMAEEAILRSDVPYTIFRPGFVYGCGMRPDSHLRKFAGLIRKGVPLHRLGFPGKISLIHVQDLASAIVTCMTSEKSMNHTYLAEVEYMPLGDALSLLGEVLNGRKPLQIQVPSFKGVIQKLHFRLPPIIAGMFLDYFWMDDQAFRGELIDDCEKKLFMDNVRDVTNDLHDD